MRANSRTYRDYPNYKGSQSKDVKTISKAKRSKQGQLPHNDRKQENHALKDIEVNELRTRPVNSPQIEKAGGRVLQKIKMVSKFISRCLDKKPRDKLAELVTLIQKEENIRNQIDSIDQERSLGMVKELRQSLNRLIERQEDLISSSNTGLVLTETNRMASGTFTKDLIGMEMSPPVKGDTFG